MDWHKEITKFKHLQVESTSVFASPGEMHQAIAAYNKAIDRLKMDSADIALISLKKLVATYPMFAQAFFLLACCEMIEEHYEEAIEHFEHVISLDLSNDEYDRVQACLFSAKEEFMAVQKKLELEQKSKSRNDDNINSTIFPFSLKETPILHKSRRSSRIRMASDKEKREVIRESDFPKEQETHIVYSKNLFDYIRRAVPILVIIVIVATVILGGISIVGLIRNKNDKSIPDEKQRLEWLEAELAGLATDNDKIVDLLRQYNQFINPDIIGTSEETSMSSKIEATVITSESTTTPTLSTTATLATSSSVEISKAQLKKQVDILKQIKDIQNEDPISAAEQLIIMQKTLAEIPADTSIEIKDPTSSEEESRYIPFSASELQDEVNSIMQTVNYKAANELRVKAKKLFDQQDYETALINYEKAYLFDPLAYGGGVAYYCGRCHQELNQYEQARPYFEFVIENFAGKELAGHAANRLNMMGF